jgi:hypothetical protein
MLELRDYMTAHPALTVSFIRRDPTNRDWVVFFDFPTGAISADELVKVSSDDTTANFLLSKLVGGSGVTLTELNPGGDEQLQIDVPGVGTDTFCFAASRNGAIGGTGAYLRGPDGTPTNLSGFVVPFNAKMIAVSAAQNGTNNWDAEVRKNGVAAPIATLTLTAVAKAWALVSVDVVAGDEIQMHCTPNAPPPNIDSPTVVALFERR